MEKMETKFGQVDSDGCNLAPKKENLGSPITLNLRFWKHASIIRARHFKPCPLVTAAQFLPMGSVWAAYSATSRIFPGVTTKQAYGQVLAENNKQMSSIEVNVDAVPR